jgi:redox-sensitive bicupin YhaK (pirin superfamily)
MKKGGYYYFNLPVAHNSFIYILDGKVNVEGDSDIEHNYAAIFNRMVTASG